MADPPLRVNPGERASGSGRRQPSGAGGRAKRGRARGFLGGALKFGLLVFLWGVIVGGAVGNAIDRLHWPGVADFVLFHIDTAAWTFRWYVFNLADVAIVAGVLGLLYESLWRGGAAKAP